jgi:hypothetical protein
VLKVNLDGTGKKAAGVTYLDAQCRESVQANRGTEIPWPLSMRWPLAIWRKLFAPAADTVAFDAKRYG